MAYVGQGSRFFARQCSTGRAWEALSFRGRVRGDVEREPLGKMALGGRVSAKIRLIDTACSSHILAKFHRVIFRTPPPHTPEADFRRFNDNGNLCQQLDLLCT